MRWGGVEWDGQSKVGWSGMERSGGLVAVTISLSVMTNTPNGLWSEKRGVLVGEC